MVGEAQPVQWCAPHGFNRSPQRVRYVQRHRPTRFTPPLILPGRGAATAAAAGALTTGARTAGATGTGRATQPLGTPMVLQ